MSAFKKDSPGPGGNDWSSAVSKGVGSEKDRVELFERWADVWDEDEYYWAADEAVPSLTGLGWTEEYEQVSVCAGVFTVRPG